MRDASIEYGTRQKLVCVLAVAVLLTLGFNTAHAQQQEEPQERLVSLSEIANSPTRPELHGAERERQLADIRAMYETSPDNWPAPHLDEGIEHHELGLLPEVQHPDVNPATKVKVELGEQLFFDPRLSGSGQIACASCHDPDLGWADGRTVAFGHNRHRLTRNSPTILNSGYRKALFWDGRAATLEEQAVAVLSNPDEMHAGEPFVFDGLGNIDQYADQFEQVFGVRSPDLSHAAMALAAYERSIVGKKTRFDSFVRGRFDKLSDEEVAGLHLFRTEGRCMNCHSGPMFTDDKFHNLGLTRYGLSFEDLGRYEITKRAQDVGAFRTPSLRNVTETRPFMHNGLFELDEVLRLYNVGMPRERRRASQQDDELFPVKSPLLKPLGLNKQDLADIEAFLGTLAEPRHRISPPDLPPGL